MNTSHTSHPQSLVSSHHPGQPYWLGASLAWSATQERPDAGMRTALLEAINSSDSFTDRFDAEVWLTDMSQRLQSRVKDPKNA